MNPSTARQLDTYLNRLTTRIREIRQLNLAVESGRQQALEESQCLLALLAMYRHTLKHAQPDPEAVVLA